MCILHIYWTEQVSFTVSNRVHEGTEFAITQGDNETLRSQLFTMFLSHDQAAAARSHSYAYAILASPDAAEAATQAAQLLGAVRALHFPLSHSFSHTNMKSPCAEQVTVLSNAKPVQAVCTRAPTQMLQVRISDCAQSNLHTNLKSGPALCSWWSGRGAAQMCSSRGVPRGAGTSLCCPAEPPPKVQSCR